MRLDFWAPNILIIFCCIAGHVSSSCYIHIIATYRIISGLYDIALQQPQHVALSLSLSSALSAKQRKNSYLRVSEERGGLGTRLHNMKEIE